MAPFSIKTQSKSSVSETKCTSKIRVMHSPASVNNNVQLWGRRAARRTQARRETEEKLQWLQEGEYICWIVGNKCVFLGRTVSLRDGWFCTDACFQTAASSALGTFPSIDRIDEYQNTQRESGPVRRICFLWLGRGAALPPPNKSMIWTQLKSNKSAINLHKITTKYPACVCNSGRPKWILTATTVPLSPSTFCSHPLGFI